MLGGRELLVELELYSSGLPLRGLENYSLSLNFHRSCGVSLPTDSALHSNRLYSIMHLIKYILSP